jgi:hypothetical protein
MVVRGQTRQKVHKIPSQSIKSWAQWHAPVIAAMVGSRNRRIVVQYSPGINVRLCSKIAKAKRAGAWLK